MNQRMRGHVTSLSQSKLCLKSLKSQKHIDDEPQTLLVLHVQVEQVQSWWTGVMSSCALEQMVGEVLKQQQRVEVFSSSQRSVLADAP